MQTAEIILQAVRKMGEKRISLERVYRSLFSEDLFLAAYGKISRNKGALTAGSDERDTVDGMSLERIRRVIDDLRYERFRFTPARRIYREKKSGGKRPLGLPNFTDKLVQEALRLLLEAYYEPRFRNSSHGFRTGRGCHTALADLKYKFKGAAWFIEGDIRGCFDHIDHEVLMGILARDIQDGRMLNLIRMGLEAGYLEDWQYNRTYSGTPQGGILSPLLANIYLNELDGYIEDVLMPQYNRGWRRATNPAYKRYEYAIQQARKNGNVERVKELERQRRQIPSQDVNDPNYRRLQYIRYADDFILSYIGPKAEAEAIKDAIGTFLKEKLHLELSPTKTLITHARTEYARFLGYAISVYHADDKISPRKGTSAKIRTQSGCIRLGIPMGKVDELVARYRRDGKVMHENELLAFGDATIVNVYQQRFRGIAEYYKYATDRRRLQKLKYFMEIAMTKTLACKHKTTVTRIYRKYASQREVDGTVYKVLAVPIPSQQGQKYAYWGGISLKRVDVGQGYIIDRTVMDQVPSPKRVELIRRLQANRCELCGSTEKCEVHHVRKLVDIKRKWRKIDEKPAWVKKMIEMRRRTLVVCAACHREIHNGQT
jgi:group II intron reverse transcriptase/maturase